MNRLEQMRERMKKSSLKQTQTERKKLKLQIAYKRKIAEKFYVTGVLWEMDADNLQKNL